MTAKAESRQNYLIRLLSTYTKFLKRYDRSDVLIGREFIVVKFYRTEKAGWIDSDETEYPVSHIEKIISKYKQKVKKEFSERHNLNKK